MGCQARTAGKERITAVPPGENRAGGIRIKEDPAYDAWTRSHLLRRREGEDHRRPGAGAALPGADISSPGDDGIIITLRMDIPATTAASTVRLLIEKTVASRIAATAYAGICPRTASAATSQAAETLAALRSLLSAPATIVPSRI